MCIHECEPSDYAAGFQSRACDLEVWVWSLGVFRGTLEPSLEPEPAAVGTPPSPKP